VPLFTCTSGGLGLGLGLILVILVLVLRMWSCGRYMILRVTQVDRPEYNHLGYTPDSNLTNLNLT